MARCQSRRSRAEICRRADGGGPSAPPALACGVAAIAGRGVAAIAPTAAVDATRAKGYLRRIPRSGTRAPPRIRPRTPRQEAPITRSNHDSHPDGLTEVVARL